MVVFVTQAVWPDRWPRRGDGDAGAVRRRRPWTGRRTFGSESESSAWAGSGRPGTSHRSRGCAGSVPDHGDLRPGLPPCRDRGGTARLRGLEGLAALVERPDVDVIYLLSPQWFGLHPIGLACAAGKAVYCALPLADDLAELESLAKRVETSRIAFMPEFARRCYPATLRLKELLATPLGAAAPDPGHIRGSLVSTATALPGPTTQITPAPLLIDPGSYLLDWCCFLFQSMPRRCRGFVCRCPRVGRANRTRIPISRASWPSSIGGRRLRSPSAAITGAPGATPPASCRSRASRSTPSAGPPGSRCPTGSSGRRRGPPGRTTAARAHRRRRAQRPVPSAGAGRQSLAPTIHDALDRPARAEIRRSQRRGGRSCTRPAREPD